MMRPWIALLLLALSGCAQQVTLASSGGGPDAVRASGAFYKPDGPGPFPAVVLLHGCNGVGPHMQTWAQRLNRWGYAAFVVDSFGPRGHASGICNQGLLVPPELRARDAFEAATWLRGQPTIDGARIGVIGFSHGGWTVMRTVLEATARVNDAAPFRAAVAYYPACAPNNARLATDTLILIGEADDWTPAARCVTQVAGQLDQPHKIEIKVYPRATHAFDAMAGPRTAWGHFMAYDPAAADDSFAMTRSFLDARLN